MTIAITAGSRSRGSLEQLLPGLSNSKQARFPKGLRFDGTGHLPCHTVVEGEVLGSLELTGESLLHVAPGGKAEGTFTCTDMCIEGTVQGEINCPDGAVEIAASAHCKVKVLYCELSVARGADVEADFVKAGGSNG